MTDLHLRQKEDCINFCAVDGQGAWCICAISVAICMPISIFNLSLSFRDTGAVKRRDEGTWENETRRPLQRRIPAPALVLVLVLAQWPMPGLGLMPHPSDPSKPCCAMLHLHDSVWHRLAYRSSICGATVSKGAARSTTLWK